MKAVLQRVTSAQVDIDMEPFSAIKEGWLVFLGVMHGDSEVDVEFVSEKINKIRAFSDKAGKMNLSVSEIAGEILVVSQFTLAADCERGRRPSFTNAASPAIAEALYSQVVDRLRSMGHKVESGKFGANMRVSLVNNGPVTLLLDSRQGK